MFGLGVLLVACGVFLLVYGGKLFRFGLAVGFFVLGFSITAWLFSSQPIAIRLLVSFVAGGVLALAGYMLVKMVLHIAGALLGAVLVLLILSFLPFSLPSLLALIVILVGAGVIGFFGNRLGDWVIILATTLAGAYALVLGLAHMFPAAMGVSADYVSAQIPFVAPAMALFLIFFATGALAQFEIRRVRGRYVNF
jgi:hypothetical protein